MTQLLRAILYVFVFLTVTTSAATKKKSMKSTRSMDPNTGGKPYGAGAVFNLTQKGVDFVSNHMNSLFTNAIRTMTAPNFTTTIDGVTGVLRIDSMRVNDFYGPGFRYEFQPRNRFVYWTEKNRFSTSGDWRLLPTQSSTKLVSTTPTPTTQSGRVTMTSSGEATLNATTEFRRATDGKVMLQFIDCVAKFERWSVDYFPANMTFVNATAAKLRKHWEDTTCKMIRDYFVEVIAVLINSFPNRIPLTADKKYVLDYDLLNNQPELANKSIKAELKGQILWQNYYTAPFWPAFETSDPQQQTSVDRMTTLRLGDYVFNTLFHHAYWQNQLRMSAYDTIPETSPLRDRLRLRCPKAIQPSCFGDVFGNATDNFPPTAIGDLVFKPERRPPTVFIRSVTNGSSFFDAYGGSLEAYAVTSHDGAKRQLLARTNVISISGDFIPTLNTKMNITGTVRLNDFQLSSEMTRLARQMKNIDATEEWREQLATLATPIVEFMINSFLERVQFPMFLPSNLECVPPAVFRLTERTMNIDCDIRPFIGQPMFMTLENARKFRKSGGKL